MFPDRLFFQSLEVAGKVREVSDTGDTIDWKPQVHIAYTFPMDEDVRWKQRLSNFRKAMDRLGSAVQLATERPLSELERQGLIQAFEFTHELSWNLMKDWFEYQGIQGITGSRDATREAFRAGLVHDGESWMEMIKSRNESSHTYNLEVADRIASAVLSRYWPLFMAFLEYMKSRESGT